MNIRTRLIAAVVVALIVGFGFMAYDKYTDAEWVVSPQTIEQARNSGQTGVETRPGTVAVRAIRSEVADLLPYKLGCLWLCSRASGALFYPSAQNGPIPVQISLTVRDLSVELQESGLLIG